MRDIVSDTKANGYKVDGLIAIGPSPAPTVRASACPALYGRSVGSLFLCALCASVVSVVNPPVPSSLCVPYPRF